MVIYGVVKYRDIFRRLHETTFGYKITPGRELVRLEGKPNTTAIPELNSTYRVIDSRTKKDVGLQQFGSTLLFQTKLLLRNWESFPNISNNAPPSV
jgi:hypothetical protein